MGHVGVYGADGFVGGLVRSELHDRGHRVVELDARGADPDRIDVASLADVDVVINAAGPYCRTACAVAAAALEVGRGYVDVGIEPDVLRRLHAEFDAPARAGGVSVVTGAGLVPAIGDLLAGIAAADQAVEIVEVAYAFPAVRHARGGRWSSGTRRSSLRLAGMSCTSWVDGGLVNEPIGSWRRLAWFPRPVGPRHAALVPGGETVLVPSWLSTARTVRTYLALAGWQAELLQATCRIVRRRSDGHLARWLARNGAPPHERVRSATRWAAVVEAEGAEGLTRAWAWGRDPYGTSAAVAVAAAEQIVRGEAPTGVFTPAELGADGLLDELAARTGLRWGVRRSGSLR